MSLTKHVGTAVIAGLGTGAGTGGACARLFAAKGFRVALIARNAIELEKLAESIRADGGEAEAFPVKVYDHSELQAAFKAIDTKWPGKASTPSTGGSGVRLAVWNAGPGLGTWGKLLDITEEQLLGSVQVNVVGAFAFGQEAVKAILASTGEAEYAAGHRGSLIYTGATAALRGGNGFAAFAAGKFGTRAISQSIAREYGPNGIHCAHVIIDGLILTGRSRITDEENKAKHADPRRVLDPAAIAKNYLFLHEQDPSAWTQELDLRPAHEKF